MLSLSRGSVLTAPHSRRRSSLHRGWEEAVTCFVVSIWFLFNFETGSCCVAQAGLKLKIFLLWSANCWFYRPQRLQSAQILNILYFYLHIFTIQNDRFYYENFKHVYHLLSHNCPSSFILPLKVFLRCPAPQRSPNPNPRSVPCSSPGHCAN